MKEFWSWLKEATWHRLALLFATLILLAAALAYYENRHIIYNKVVPNTMTGDWPLAHPTQESQAILAAFAKRHPQAALITIIDADPERNRRTVVYRHFNNHAVEEFVRAKEATGVDGAGLLYTANDIEANKQVLAINDGQVICDDASKGFFANAFKGVERLVSYSCRVPIPPAAFSVTGWISIHFVAPPELPTEELRQQMLALAMAYYKADILPKLR